MFVGMARIITLIFAALHNILVLIPEVCDTFDSPLLFCLFNSASIWLFCWTPMPVDKPQIIYSCCVAVSSGNMVKKTQSDRPDFKINHLALCRTINKKCCWYLNGRTEVVETEHHMFFKHNLRISSFIMCFSTVLVNPSTAKLFNWNFHPLEVVDRVSETQL